MRRAGTAAASSVVAVQPLANPQPDEKTLALDLSVRYAWLWAAKASVRPDHRFCLHHFNLIDVNGQASGQIGYRLVDDFLEPR